MPHKRAVVWQGVLVELILVGISDRPRSSFFDGRFILEWPEDTFDAPLLDCPVPVIHSRALALYRAQHAFIEQARDAYLRGM